MKLKSSHLAPAIQNARSAIGNEKTMQILAHVLIETGDNVVTITGSDLQTEIKTTVEAEIKTPGAVCINGYTLAAFSKNAGDRPISIEWTEKSAQLKAKSRSKINTQPAADYPTMPQEQDALQATLILNAETLSNAIAKVEHCAGKNDVRYYLNGILISNQGQQLTLTASDGHRLAILSITADQHSGESLNCIIPIKTASVIAKIYKKGQITLRFSNNQFSVKNDTTTLTCKTIDSRYPDFSRIFEIDRPYQSELLSELFVSAIASAVITASKDHKGIKLTIGENKITASSFSNGEESTATVECHTEGNSYKSAFSATYLMAAAEKIAGQMYINSDGVANIVIQPRDRSVTYLIMSMKL